MEPEHRILFGPFCLDVTQSRLWRGAQVIGLRPRSLSVNGFSLHANTEISAHRRDQLSA
jgi:hypothetical protein